MKVARWIVLPDMQVRYEDHETLAAVEQYMADNRWDGAINLGDFLDFNELSTHVIGKPGAFRRDSVSKTFEAGNARLDSQLAAVRARNKNARYVLLEGNHDYRAKSYVDRYPEHGEHLDVRKNLRLKERRVEWVPSWSEGKLFRLGNAFFTHGLITSKYHAEKMVYRFGVPIYYGHTHDVMEFAAVLHGADKTIVGKSLGCLCRYDQPYLKGAPTNWQQAFAVFSVMPDGFYTEHTVRIFKHRFIAPDGKLYDGRRRTRVARRSMAREMSWAY